MVGNSTRLSSKKLTSDGHGCNNLYREELSLQEKKLLSDKKGDETKEIKIIERKKEKYLVDNRAKKLRSFFGSVWWATCWF